MERMGAGYCLKSLQRAVWDYRSLRCSLFYLPMSPSPPARHLPGYLETLYHVLYTIRNRKSILQCAAVPELLARTLGLSHRVFLSGG